MSYLLLTGVTDQHSSGVHEIRWGGGNSAQKEGIKKRRPSTTTYTGMYNYVQYTLFLPTKLTVYKQ